MQESVQSPYAKISTGKIDNRSPHDTSVLGDDDGRLNSSVSPTAYTKKNIALINTPH